jgi:tRNA dimethylallyltransferase
MSSESFADVLILTGPTASGKSALALELAERLGAEIVAMDSMTLYRGLDVGTAKPTPEERRRVPHHLIDVIDPWESASVAWWLERAAACCQDIVRRGKRPLMVGGTGLYLKAVLCGLFDGPPADEDIRRKLLREAASGGPEALHARLLQVDPPSAARLHPNDIRRVVRALEVWELTRRPMSTWQTQWTGQRGLRIEDRGPSFDPRPSILDPRSSPVWLDLPRDELYRRINVRVEAMIAGGLVEEVRALRRLPRPLSREASQAHPDTQPQLRQAASDVVSPPAGRQGGRASPHRGIDNCRLGVDNTGVMCEEGFQPPGRARTAARPAILSRLRERPPDSHSQQLGGSGSLWPCRR